MYEPSIIPSDSDTASDEEELVREDLQAVKEAEQPEAAKERVSSGDTGYHGDSSPGELSTDSEAEKDDRKGLVIAK